MIDRAALHGYDVHAFDNRMDLAVPVVTALAVRRDGGPGTLSFSAARRARSARGRRGRRCPRSSRTSRTCPTRSRSVMTELRAMARDYSEGAAPQGPCPALRASRNGRARRASYLDPTGVLPLDEVYGDWADGTAEDRRPAGRPAFLRDRLVAAGYDVVVVDQTTPEQRGMGLHTVCMIVPGHAADRLRLGAAAGPAHAAAAHRAARRRAGAPTSCRVGGPRPYRIRSRDRRGAGTAGRRTRNIPLCDGDAQGMRSGRPGLPGGSGAAGGGAGGAGAGGRGGAARGTGQHDLAGVRVVRDLEGLGLQLQDLVGEGGERDFGAMVHSFWLRDPPAGPAQRPSDPSQPVRPLTSPRLPLSPH